MKRTLTALSFAVLASSAVAANEAATSPNFDSIPPTIEQVLAEAYRLNAGESDQDNVVRTPVADAYRLDAGESDQDNVARTQFG